MMSSMPLKTSMRNTIVFTANKILRAFSSGFLSSIVPAEGGVFCNGVKTKEASALSATSCYTTSTLSRVLTSC